MTQLHDLTALEQGELISTGKLSPVELTDHYLERVGRLNATVGAFVTVTPELARRQAAEAEEEAAAARREGRTLSPLHGVPVPVKDLNLVAGVRATLGSAAFAENVPDTDDHVVTRLRNAGTIMTGKTNTPEFGLPCYTENQVAAPPPPPRARAGAARPRRSPPGWRRSRTPATAAARSGSPPRSADCSGSSPAAAGSAAAPPCTTSAA
jgi:amidase